MIKPHGGKLINIKETRKRKYEYKIKLNYEQKINLHNIINGTYSPLKGFLNKDDFLSVLKNIKLKNGIIWPIPIILDITEKQKEEINNNINIKNILLTDKYDKHIALLKDFNIYKYSKKDYSQYIFGTINKKHPGVKRIYSLNDYLIGGKIKLLSKTNINLKINKYYSPKETRNIFKKKGWKNIVAFQTRNPPHISHEYLQRCALEGCDGLFINPVIGKKKKGDFKDKYIIGAYDILIKNYYKKNNVHLGILPITMQYAGPREAILHAIIRQNFGCSHIIIGRDHAGVGNFYGTYDAQNIFDNFTKKDINIKVLKYENASFCNICKTVTTNKTCPHSNKYKIHISGTEIRKKIKRKEILPLNFMRKEISKYLIKGNNQFTK